MTSTPEIKIIWLYCLGAPSMVLDGLSCCARSKYALIVRRERVAAISLLVSTIASGATLLSRFFNLVRVNGNKPEGKFLECTLLPDTKKYNVALDAGLHQEVFRKLEPEQKEPYKRPSTCDAHVALPVA